MLAGAKHDFGIICHRSLERTLGQPMTPSKGDAAGLYFLEIGLVPEHGCLAILGAQGVDHAVKHVLLQTPIFRAVGSGYAELAFQSLALGAVCPAVECGIACLVTPKVYVGRRENVGQLLEHIAKELESKFATRA